jgi:chemotaxis protein MotC
MVEEAALLRSVGIAAAQGDAARFALASTQYVASYLYSPYASQFADAFVSGVITLHMAISQDKIADITSMMDPEREKVIYLRIARRAAIDGMTELSAFAAAKAELDRNGSSQDDPRTQLYSSLSTMTSASVDEVRAKLGKIDRGKLSQNDRDLLDAAQAVAGEVVAPVKTPAKAEAAPAASKGDGAKEAVEASADPANADLPPVEGAMPDQPAVASSGPPVPASNPPVASGDPVKDTPPAASPPSAQPLARTTAETPAGAPMQADAAPVVQASAPGTSNAQDPIDAAVASARRQLDQIDQLLGAAPK